MTREHEDRNGYWYNELNSLGIEPKKRNELNDETELAALAENIKQTFYQDYKTAYSADADESQLDHII